MNKIRHITLLLLTKNESENISQHFKWLHNCPIINQIIAVDDNSQDNTKEELKKLASKHRKIKVYNKSLNNDFSEQRNFGVEKSKNNWILWLDADEEPSEKMQEFLNNFKFNQKLNYSFKRNDVFLGKELKHGENGNQYFIRLFHKRKGKFERPVHEIWNSELPSIKKDITILHFPHKDIKSFLNKINFYTDIRAQELFEKKVEVRLRDIVLYPFGKFFYNYIIRMGFLDSTQGIIMALSMSFHSFLVRAKLWHLYQK